MNGFLHPIAGARSSACRLTALIALAFTVAAPAAHAQSEAYVAEVFVDETAENAVAAADAARRSARRRAFAIVARRLSPRAAWDRLDSVLAGPQDTFGPLTATEAANAAPPILDAEIARAEAELTVLSERSTGVRYAASFDVAFRPEAIETLLADRGVPTVRPRAQPGLLLAVLTEGGRSRTLDGHAWADAFEALRLERSVAPMVTPVGDFGDLQALGARRPEIWEDVAAIAARYAAPDVILAEARLFYDGSRAGVRAGAIRLSIDGPPRRLGFEIFKSGPADEADRVLAQAARDVLAEVEDAYKARVSGPGGEAGVLLIDARTEDFEGWVRLTQALEGSASVSDTATLAVMRQGALIEVRHLGGADQLSRELRERGLSVSPSSEAEDGTTVLRVDSPAGR